ncbi:MAG: sensor histidine kinase [Paracoccaceae bacterium]|jgi:two-component system sensor histidine kinase TctE|nr:sensor histidine kinase [Paracoccaceae bacterium]MDP7184511.1 sensor histidine kinase [Paracoccaceae bacterium]
MRRASLRLRLFGLIVTPLIVMAVILGYWRFMVAQNTAEDLFDRSLLSAALAISRDVVISEGDAILPSTRDLIRDASGGEVFYHATGPGGIYVTGYAYPPIAKDQGSAREGEIVVFEATYRDEPVRVLQVIEQVTVENLSGNTTVTVWQRMADRQAFANLLAARAAALIAGLLATLALVVWFGVKLGLRPLEDLQQAISIRSPDDLSRIKRAVPVETKGIVQTLNRLFGQVETSINAHQAFISDAAHQLRNPAAAVQSMAEAVQSATSKKDRDERLGELVRAAQNSARVAEQLLSLDRLQQPVNPTTFKPVDLREIVETTCADVGARILTQGIDFKVALPNQPIRIDGDRVFLAEAIKNLIDNAAKHGGKNLSAISVSLSRQADHVSVTVSDDGKGLTPDQSKVAFGRFSQVEPSDGSGLGLAIAASVAERHNGSLVINPVEAGASLSLFLPSQRQMPAQTGQ